MKKPSPIDYVSTSQVADSLGVGVSTVKRWVEEGILPAQKTAGGHRKLLMADVLELARHNNLPLAQPGHISKRRSRSRTADPAAVCDQLYASLLDGDVASVRRIALDGRNYGMPIEMFADTVVAPAMHRIGNDWEKGRIDVLHEHRATQLCLGVLYELKTALESRARRDRPVAVGGALEGDYSEIASLLAQMVLLEAGWEAINLGPNTPIASFARSLAELRPRLIWISFSHTFDEEQLIREYRAFYRRAEKADVPVIIGGRALSESLRSALPYTAYGDGLNNLAAFARTLVKPPRRPQRGRPKLEPRD